MGEAAEVRGRLWVACGFCAHGVSGGGGVGKAMAEWIVAGEPSLDMWHMDIRRFGAHTSSRRYIAERASEIYKNYYSINLPGQEKSSARELRLSPVYSRLKEMGAASAKNGWERPNWFAPNEHLAQGQGWPEPRGWARRFWSPAIGAEHQTTRERVALFDETSFSKIEAAGRGALISVFCSASPPSTGQTHRLRSPTRNCSIRAVALNAILPIPGLAEDRFQIITGTAFGTHDLAWLQRHLPGDGSVYLRDVTSGSCCLGVMGRAHAN